MKVTVILNTRNAAQTLDRCLRSAAWADEIIVLDMGSDDETVEIARRHKAQVYACSDSGCVGSPRNLAISHATGDWIFVLDPDEVIPSHLAANVRRIIDDSSGCALIAIPRQNYIGDYAIKNSGWGTDYQPRLFKRGSVVWSDAAQIWPQIEGDTRYLSPDSGYYIKRYNYANLSDFIAHLNSQTSVEARTLMQKGEWASWRDILREAIKEFDKGYTPKEDGFHSLALAGCMAFYRFAARCKQLEQIRETEGDLIFPLPESLEEIAAEVLTHMAPGLMVTQNAARRYEEVSVRLRGLEEELAETRAAYERQIESLSEELARERSACETQLSRMSDELASARTQVSGYEAQLTQVNDQLEAVSSLLSEREAELEQRMAYISKLRGRTEKDEEVLEWIQTSRSWKFASVLRRAIDMKHQWRQHSYSLARGLRIPVQPIFRGLIESPTEAATVAGEMEIKGWVFSTIASVCLVEAFLDDFYLGRLSYGIKRLDVATAYSDQARIECGYSERVPLAPSMLGRRKLTVRVHDTQGNMQIYTRLIVVGSQHVRLPASTSVSRRGRRAAPAQVVAENDEESGFYSQIETLVNEFKGRTEREPSILNWNTGLNLAEALPQAVVFSPPYTNGHYALPYLDRSVDIVVVSADDSRQLAEANRVALAAVVRAHGVEARQSSVSPGMGDAGQGIRLVAEWKDGVVGDSVLPSASIIIPVYNKVEYTEKCLEQVLRTLPKNFSGEIIVVDDASSDGTPEALDYWMRHDERISVIRNQQNEGFIFSCNRGAAAARGEVLVFLNNDTLPQHGWLPPLLRLLRERTDAGVVGGKLLYPDGTLQEAGGVIFSDATGCNFGRKDKSPNSPIYSFVREVDYCSGALLATPRALFSSLGGFDTRYAPAYYEDTDYCFSVRAAGRRVYYQPESIVIHFEGVSSGTNIKRGVKSYQAVNRIKFMEKWRHVLEHHPAAPSRYDFVTLHGLSVRDEPRDGNES